jgi:hypothetical protein
MPVDAVRPVASLAGWRGPPEVLVRRVDARRAGHWSGSLGEPGKVRLHGGNLLVARLTPCAHKIHSSDREPR